MAHRFGDNDPSTLKALSAWLLDEMLIEDSGAKNEPTRARREACAVKKHALRSVYNAVINALYGRDEQTDGGTGLPGESMGGA